MVYQDHVPAHFHARYGGHELLIPLESNEFVGYLPSRALALVLEWRELHLRELRENWDRSQQQLSLHPISPLE